MKSHSLNVLMVISVVSITACSQQYSNRSTIQPQQPTKSTKTYYVDTQKQKAQQVVFQRQQVAQERAIEAQRRIQQNAARAAAIQKQNRQKALHRQTVSQQQVRRSQVQTPNRTVVPRPVAPRPQGNDISELYGIGDKIFRNETGGRIDQLTHWNLREDFASMGIGHFTWYPAGRQQRFGNTFPGLLDYLQQNGVRLPQCCLLYTSPSPRDKRQSRMPSSA